MKATILDGSQKHDETGQRVLAALMREFQTRGWDVEQFALCDRKIGNCAGDFFCWVRTPGMCNVNDDNRTIAAAIVNSDLVVYLTPVTFGGYSSTLKGMVDHQIQNVSPFFAKIEGETHHKKRYMKNPNLLAVGWMDMPDVHAEAIFRHLVQRNGVNWHVRTWVSGLVLASQSNEAIRASVQKWLDAFRRGQSSTWVELPAVDDPWVAFKPEADVELAEVKRALLLVGSPKTRKSTSNSLGGYLFEQLEARSVEITTIYLHTVLRNTKRFQAALEAVDAADLVTLAFPLYVDTLPAPVTEALERICEHRQRHSPPRRQLFTAIANCGYPEAYQTATAVAICQRFALQAGFAWAGSLALGGGEMINGASLVEAGGMTIRIRRSLEMAAEALAGGQAIPEAAQLMMEKPIVPHWVYRLMAWWRWKKWAKGYNASKHLDRRPYLAPSSGAGKRARRRVHHTYGL